MESNNTHIRYNQTHIKTTAQRQESLNSLLGDLKAEGTKVKGHLSAIGNLHVPTGAKTSAPLHRFINGYTITIAVLGGTAGVVALRREDPELLAAKEKIYSKLGEEANVNPFVVSNCSPSTNAGDIANVLGVSV